MPDKTTDSIYSWSQNPSENNVAGGIQFYEGIAPSQLNNSNRALMASVAKYVADQGYANNTVAFGSNNIQVTLATNITDLVPGMIVRFIIPNSAGSPPAAPYLRINNLSSDKAGNNGTGLPLAVNNGSAFAAAPSSLFTAGSIVTAVYCPDLHLWTPSALAAEQTAVHHLTGDTRGLMKADPQWNLYATDMGSFLCIDPTGNISGGAQFQQKSGIPAGMIAPFYLAASPSGWLPCDGAPFDPTVYPDLYAALNMSRTPDMRGLVARGIGGDTGATAAADKNVLGQVQQDAVGSFSISGTTDATGSGTIGLTPFYLYGVRVPDSPQQTGYIQSGSTGTASGNLMTGTADYLKNHTHTFAASRQSYETRMKNMGLLMCISTGVLN